MGLSAAMQITDQDINTESSVQNSALIGQKAWTSDGRAFCYAVSAGAISAGQITEPLASTANYTNRAITTSAAIGATQISVVLGTTAAANLFNGYYLNVNDNTGQGQGVYYITGNTAATAGNSNTTVLNIQDGLRVAISATATATDVSIAPNVQSSVIQHTAVVAIPTAGAPVMPITSGYFFWNQTGGVASLLSDGAITKNVEAIPSDATAGAVEIRVDATVVKAVGYAPELTVTTDYYPIFMTLSQ